MYRFIFLFIFLFISCKTFYTGSFDQPNLNLEQPEELSAIVSKWEDGNRTTGKSNEFEWWYFDTKLNNGALLVCYFYKVHFLQDKYFIGLNYNDQPFSKEKGYIIWGSLNLQKMIDAFERFI